MDKTPQEILEQAEKVRGRALMKDEVIEELRSKHRHLRYEEHALMEAGEDQIMGVVKSGEKHAIVTEEELR